MVMLRFLIDHFFRPLTLASATLVLLPAAALAAKAAPQIWQEPHTGMPFIALPKGCFQMGSAVSAKNAMDGSLYQFRYGPGADEQPRHEVCVDAFLMGQFEVRASDWVKVMGENPPGGSGSEPAGGVSHDSAREFARRLTQLSAGKYRFRLPTEGEWEYACRAGKKKETQPFLDDRVDVAWYSVSGRRVPQPNAVGALKANAWGLHDMLGNVWEWVEDGYQPNAYAAHALYNPLVKEAPNGDRVIRGAGHRSDFIQVRCAKRAFYPASDALGQIGLRLVRQP
jgi:formylglycine-generating enzyme required for sulfatase activity